VSATSISGDTIIHDGALSRSSCDHDARIFVEANSRSSVALLECK
jgi:hypothetical protein